MTSTRTKIIVVLALATLGAVLPAAAARRSTATSPPPASGTVVAPVFSAL